jgi:DNA-binding NtrC family response regulator
LGKIFLKAGFQVSEARDGTQASELLKQEHYPLVVLDLKMPGKPALELLREIKAETPESKVIIVTAFGDTLSYRQAMDAGAFACLDKPVKRKEILETTGKALEEIGL